MSHFVFVYLPYRLWLCYPFIWELPYDYELRNYGDQCGGRHYAPYARGLELLIVSVDSILYDTLSESLGKVYSLIYYNTLYTSYHVSRFKRRETNILFQYLKHIISLFLVIQLRDSLKQKTYVGKTPKRQNLRREGTSTRNLPTTANKLQTYLQSQNR